MKKTIRLNERELHRLISESVKRVLKKNINESCGGYLEGTIYLTLIKGFADYIEILADEICEQCNNYYAEYGGQPLDREKVFDALDRIIDDCYADVKISNYKDERGYEYYDLEEIMLSNDAKDTISDICYDFGFDDYLTKVMIEWVDDAVYELALDNSSDVVSSTDMCYDDFDANDYYETYRKEE